MSNLIGNNLPELEEAIVIDIPGILHALQRHWKKIAAFSALCTVASAFFAFGVYQEKYRSEATLLFNPTELPTVISNIPNTNVFLKGWGAESSPFKNQEELLKSRVLARKVLQHIHSEHLSVQAKTPDELLGKVISAAHIRNTDFIRISAEANKPEVAQKVARIYLDTYLAIMKNLAYEPLELQKNSFAKQVHKAEQELANVSEKVQAYQQKYGIIDINTESQIKVNHFEALVASKRGLDADLAKTQGEMRKLLSQLDLSPKEIQLAINSTASGQNEDLANLQAQLNKLQQDYAVKALTFAPTNPEMERMSRQIAVLQKQITDQQIMTIGNTLGDKTPLIKDKLRGDMVDRLAKLESEKSALQNKRSELSKQIGTLHHDLKDLPEHQLDYARLILDKKSKENILTRLREKLAEVEIQVASAQKKLSIVDEPSLPQKPLMPSRLMIVLVGCVSSMGLAALAVATSAVIAPSYANPAFIESALRIPVLASIPWLPEKVWRQCRSRKKLEMVTTPMDARVIEAYQTLALNLKIQRNHTQRKALVVSSILAEAEEPFVLANLAYCLAQSGEKVVLIDACLRNPSLHEAFGHSLNYETGLPEVINALSESVFRHPEARPEELAPVLDKFLVPSGIHPSLSYINAGLSIENTFEFLNSSGIKQLVELLKTRFDWVLFNAPPFIGTSDAAVLLSTLDALLLIVEQQATDRHIQQVQHKIHKLSAQIAGAVFREPKQ